MVELALLENPDVRRWLNGVEPAWTMLDWHSFKALHDEPSASNQAIRLEADLTNSDISGSAGTTNALILLRQAAETGGLKLTATGNLSRAVVDELREVIHAPDYDKEELVRYSKVNEPDFLPLHFIRILTQGAKLLRKHRGKLVPTPLGRRMAAAEQSGPLHALLFQIAFWRMNLAYFDRVSLATWPQSQIGVILWSLSASAHDWLPRETLTRLCSRPVDNILKSTWDFGSSAMEARILRPLAWFGLLAWRTEVRKRANRAPIVPKSTAVRSFGEIRRQARGLRYPPLASLYGITPEICAVRIRKQAPGRAGACAPPSWHMGWCGGG